jgi:dTMP kinase
VRAGFLTLARTDPDRYLVLDATVPPNVVTELIKDRIREVLPDPVPRAAEANTGSFPAIPDAAPAADVADVADVADRR